MASEAQIETPRAAPGKLEWDKKTVSLNDLTLPYSFFPAAKNSKEVATVVGCCGLNTVDLWEDNEIEQLNAEGISVVSLGLPPRRNKDAFISRYTDLAAEFFFNPDSPAHTLTDESLPRHTVTHSTGSQIYWRAVQTSNNADAIPLFYASETHICPMLHPSNISNSVANAVFKAHSRLFWNTPTLKTPGGMAYAAYSVFRSGATIENWNNWPTPFEIDHVEQCGGELMTSFNPKSYGGRVPVTIIIGKKDTFADPDTTLKFANMIGADKIRIINVGEGGHSTLTQRPSLLTDYIREVHHDARQRRNENIPISLTRDWPEADFLPDLSNGRLGLALQRGAGLLNTPTRLLKSLFGSRVGNAEVGREAEGHALHASNAFRFQ